MICSLIKTKEAECWKRNGFSLKFAEGKTDLWFARAKTFRRVGSGAVGVTQLRTRRFAKQQS